MTRPLPRASRLAELGTVGRGVSYATLGAAAGLGQAPWGLWPVTLVALALALTALRHERRWRGAFWAGWALGLGYFALTLHWIVQPFLVDVARHGWMAPFALLFMAGGLAVFWGVAAVLARGFGPTARLMALVTLLTLAEMTRSVVLTGFPWALVGHVWIGTPIAQLSAIAGPHGLTFLTLALAAAISVAGLSLRLVLPGIVVGLGLVAFDPGPAASVSESRPLVRIVQPNARQDIKWQPGMAEMFFQRLLKLSQGGPAGPPPDVTIWPETAVQWMLDDAGGRLRTAAAAAQGPVVTGIQRREGRRFFNSLVVVDGTGTVVDLYDKAHLVPFGEYMPFGEVAGRFGITGLAASDGGGYTPGPGPGLVEIPGLGAALALICYEGIFAGEVGAMPRRPGLIVLVTNDAWFGSWAGPAQHLSQARLRAIEQGLPLVRAANTGISAMIDARGRVTGQLDLGVEGALDRRLPAPLPPTIYARHGDWPMAVLLLFLGAVAFFVGRRE